ncbi:MAG: XRE family transcriptional regulator [Polyangiaceae bacterium]
MAQHLDDHLASNLAANMKFLRQQRGITQAKLAKQASVPRSTVATLEIGDGNPTLSVLSRISLALQVSIEELLSTPRAPCQLFPKGSLPSASRAQGKVHVSKLLPDPIPGMEFERVEIAPGGRMVGVPHRPGTREYLCCERGSLTLVSGGERYVLQAGDVAAFRGDQRHSYLNDGSKTAVGFSVVTLVSRLVDGVG